MFICYVHVNIVKLSRHENVRDINLFNKLIVVKGFRLIIPKIITINRAYSIELKRLENNTTTFTVFLFVLLARYTIVANQIQFYANIHITIM